MSRLYFPPPPGEVQLRSGTDQGGEYFKKVVSFIPSEILTGYLFLVNLAKDATGVTLRNSLFAIAFALCLVLTPIYIYKVSKDERKEELEMRRAEDPTDKRPERRQITRTHVVVATIAFIVWAYAVSGQLVLPPGYYNAIISIFVIAVFSLITGVIPME